MLINDDTQNLFDAINKKKKQKHEHKHEQRHSEEKPMFGASPFKK